MTLPSNTCRRRRTLNIWLMARWLLRNATKVALSGDEGNVIRRMRAHANFAESVPPHRS
jgi:hypothetical protein